MSSLTPDARRRFIVENTRLITPPHVPEIRLHLADEQHDIWYQTEDSLAALGIDAPFWAFAWAGGQGLARFVLDHPEMVAGRDVIDFACGSGVVGVAAAVAGASSVTCVDIDPFCEDAVRLNAEANGVEVTAKTEDMVGQPLRDCVLLAGDVFYDPEFADTLQNWFETLLKSGVNVLVGDPGRHYLPENRLTQLAEYQIPVARVLEDAEVKRTRVWTF